MMRGEKCVIFNIFLIIHVFVVDELGELEKENSISGNQGLKFENEKTEKMK